MSGAAAPIAGEAPARRGVKARVPAAMRAARRLMIVMSLLLGGVLEGVSCWGGEGLPHGPFGRGSAAARAAPPPAG